MGRLPKILKDRCHVIFSKDRKVLKLSEICYASHTPIIFASTNNCTEVKYFINCRFVIKCPKLMNVICSPYTKFNTSKLLTLSQDKAQGIQFTMQEHKKRFRRQLIPCKYLLRSWNTAHIYGNNGGRPQTDRLASCLSPTQTTGNPWY